VIHLVNYLALGKELLEGGCPQGAVQAFDECIRRQEYIAEAHLYRARAYMELQAYVHAANDLELAEMHDARLSGVCSFHRQALERRRSRSRSLGAALLPAWSR
jgi:tetratricopeptide (TPR) repeat protein